MNKQEINFCQNDPVGPDSFIKNSLCHVTDNSSWASDLQTCLFKQGQR